MRRQIIAATLSILGAGLIASSAVAQSQVTMFEAEEIVGEVQLPSVQIFVTRQNLNTDYDLELEESFLPKIVESVEERPF
ncbi:MAG: hypothetical protein VX899_25910 [Myxococcota bacterium]|nr:hypothetical protein [Myxococcota bacterium]